MKLLIATSQVKDGSMKGGLHDQELRQRRRDFLTKNGTVLEKTVLVNLVYEGDDYCRYREVTQQHAGEGIIKPIDIVADALFTREADLALFLPLADCIGAVLFDTRQHIVGLSHLGRHNLEQFGARKSTEYMVNHFGSDPADIMIYMSPAAGKEGYPLYSFGNRSMYEVACEQFIEAGIRHANITIDDKDTVSNPSYYSHSAYLKGDKVDDGRHAVVTMLRDE